MLTPLDIHNKAFTKGMRGYRMEEVDAFLDEVIHNYETLFRENHDLKERVQRMEDEVARSKDLSSSLQKTMLLAQKLVDEETVRAKKEGELIQWEARKKGQQFIQEAHDEVLSIKQEIERLKLYEKQLYLKHKGFLEFQMELLNGYKEDAELTEIQKETAIPAAEAVPAEKEAAAIAAAANETELQGEATGEALKNSETPEVPDGQEGSMEQVFLMAQKMEEALKTLDQIYGNEGSAEVSAEAGA
ncbi:MAG TPA: hypothetical protein DIT32_07405 [Peptococcaceae bacterium]|nr:hypothetical protein [Peptococcaceae bacterium]